MQTETLDSESPAAPGDPSIPALAKLGELSKERAQLHNDRINGVKP